MGVKWIQSILNQGHQEGLDGFRATAVAPCYTRQVHTRSRNFAALYGFGCLNTLRKWWMYLGWNNGFSPYSPAHKLVNSTSHGNSSETAPEIEAFHVLMETILLVSSCYTQGLSWTHEGCTKDRLKSSTSPAKGNSWSFFGRPLGCLSGRSLLTPPPLCTEFPFAGDVGLLRRPLKKWTMKQAVVDQTFNTFCLYILWHVIWKGSSVLLTQVW